jgi:hypothetical protein
MGDHVVAFYSKDGKIRNYSLEQALGYPDRIDKKAFDALVQRSVSGRSWVTEPMFLERHEERILLCVWLLHGKRWRAWDAATGSDVAITDAMVERWGEKGRQWARRVVKKGKQCVAALCLLGRDKRPEDRTVIESFLARNDFGSSYDRRDRTFLGCCGRSFYRDLAEQLLAVWDGRDANALERWNGVYHYLGVVAGSVRLPRPPHDGDGHLCMYLLPGAAASDDWYQSVPVHRVTAYFWKYSFSSCDWPGATIPFRIEGVTPGTYRVKAVWDKAEPFTFGDDYIRGPLGPGDCENAEAPSVTVGAGERVEGLSIDCTREIAG